MLETLEAIADPKNAYKPDGSVYIPDVVQAVARNVIAKAKAQ
jgi:hypothetical protein